MYIVIANKFSTLFTNVIHQRYFSCTLNFKKLGVEALKPVQFVDDLRRMYEVLEELYVVQNIVLDI